MRLLVVIGLLLIPGLNVRCAGSEDTTVSVAMSTIFDGAVLQDNVRTTSGVFAGRLRRYPHRNVLNCWLTGSYPMMDGRQFD
ncbi:MAG: hypothetical protein O2856_00605 [Planctomycetota bacterium]|nr:hypothetical protein [Planctomycetota bacterium]